MVVGEFVQGIALFRTTGKQMVALSRCITQHFGSPCKVEFHRLDCATRSLHPEQECLPTSSVSGTPTWDLTGASNTLGNSLQLAIRVPAGAQGLAFKAEDVIFGGYLLLCFASATQEAIDVYAFTGYMDDSCYLFATPFTVDVDDALQISRNEILVTVLDRVVKSDRIVSDSPGNCLEMVAPDSLIWESQGSLFQFQFSIPIVPLLTVGFSINFNWVKRLDLNLEICPREFSVSAALVPSVRLEVDARGFVTLLVLRGGIGATATILDSKIIPAVKMSLFPLPGIEFTSKLEIRPLAVEIYIFAEHFLCVKWCGWWPCLQWCSLFKIHLARWSMRAIQIKGPGMRIDFPDLTPPKPGSVVAFQTSPTSVNVEWLGFVEEDSEISNYLVCIGSGADDSEFMPCLDVKLATSFQGQDLSIPHTSQIVVTIWCVIQFLSFFHVACMRF